jgi:hypothetical protein
MNTYIYVYIYLFSMNDANKVKKEAMTAVFNDKYIYVYKYK